MTNELEQAINRQETLQLAQEHLAAAMPAVMGMDKAYEAVRTAYRIVSRQAGKATAKVKELEQKEAETKEDTCDECGERVDADHGGLVSSLHGDSCSLNPTNVTGP